jgi:hypothetical protein
MTWFLSDYKNWIIAGLLLLLIIIGSYAVGQKWQAADKDQQISAMKVENATLTINNKNLTAQRDQLQSANEACNTYIGKLFSIKKETAKINEKIDKMGGPKDETDLHNDLVGNWNSGK